jgi:hypothetical protein
VKQVMDYCNLVDTLHQRFKDKGNGAIHGFPESLTFFSYSKVISIKAVKEP